MMKKITTLLFAAAATVTTYAQEIEFKTQFRENSSYNQVMKKTMDMEMIYQGDQEMLDMLEAQGVKNPTVNTTTATTTSVIKTGKTKDNVTPISMSIKTDSDKIANLAPEGMQLYGTVKPNQAPVFDSINAPGMEENLKAIIFATMKSTLSQLYIPAKKVKVGESFTVDTPLKIPAGPIEIEFKTTTTYTLKKVEGKKAFFDLKFVVTLDDEIKGSTMKGSGTGTGNLVYDVTNNYITSMNSVTDMTMDMDMMGIMLKMTTKDSSSLTVTMGK